ncbi:MAG: helix-turn-helix transcriptional regulator [Rickettsiales bacterium]|jgi:transcriptional regulator with XRE-family HTH domain|nr:helix-turn-helix transcriptional regulator [Rickettsiales bacterium]
MFHPIDVYVGKRVRFKRKVMGLTQSDLAQKVDITFQQIQKYEKGENRVSASMLYQIAQSLNTSVSFFFEGYSEDSIAESGIKDDKVSIDLINSFANIKNPELKKRLLMLITSVSETEQF